MLIATVWDATASVVLAAERVEDAARQQQTVDSADVEIVDRWLRDVAQIAAISCDQPDPISKGLGAKLEARTSSFEAQLKGTAGSRLDPRG